MENLNELAGKFYQQLTPEIMEYLVKQRGIHPDAIKYFQLGYAEIENINRITIPVRDENGHVDFFKIRRDPGLDAEDEVAKYTVFKGFAPDKSSKGSGLFNIESLKAEKDFVVITEGELDAILLTSHGITAVSYTTGAGCLPVNCHKYFQHLKEVIVCQDSDDRGIEGTRKIADMLRLSLPKSTIVKVFWLPKEFKDITEYIMAGNSPEDIIAGSEGYHNSATPITASEFCKLTLTDPDWIVERFLAPKSVTLLVSEAKNYKTFIALQAAKCISLGLPLFGFMPTIKGKVLIVNEENAIKTMHNRLKMMGFDGNIDVGLLNFTKIKIDSDGGLNSLKEHIKEGGYKVVILDPLVSLHEGDENNSKDMRKFFERLQDLMNLDVGIILNHHANKGNASGPRSYRGSTDIPAFVANSFTVSKKAKGKALISHDLSRDDETIDEFAVGMIYSGEVMDFIKLDSKEKNQLKEDDWLNAVQFLLEKFSETSSSGITVEQIHKDLPDSGDKPGIATIRRKLKVLIEDGLVEQYKDTSGKALLFRFIGK